MLKKWQGRGNQINACLWNIWCQSSKNSLGLMLCHVTPTTAEWSLILNNYIHVRNRMLVLLIQWRQQVKCLRGWQRFDSRFGRWFQLRYSCGTCDSLDLSEWLQRSGSINVSFRIIGSAATGLLHTTGCCMTSNVNRVLCEKDVSIEN